MAVAFEAESTTLYAPGVVATPLITPLAASMLSPVGSPCAAYVSTPVVVVAVTVSWTGEPSNAVCFPGFVSVGAPDVSTRRIFAIDGVPSAFIANSM